MIGTGVFLRLFSGPTIAALAVSSTKVSFDRFPPPSSSGWSGRVLGEVLVGAVGAEHVGRAHAADASVVSVVRRAGRIVGRQVIERRRDSRGVEVVPERRALAPQHGRGRLVVERPEVELEPVVAHLPEPLAGQGLGGRVKRGALVLRVAVDEVEDPVRAGPGAVDEVGPRHGTLRRGARAQAAETPARSELFQVGEQTSLHHALRKPGVHAVHADHDHLLPEAPRDVTAATQPVVSHAYPAAPMAPRPATAAEPFSKALRCTFGSDASAIKSPFVPTPGRSVCVQTLGQTFALPDHADITTSARDSGLFAGRFRPASPTVSTLPSM